MRIIIAAAALFALAACETFPPSGPVGPPPPLPATGPIAYTCADGTQLMVDFQGDEARVAIIGGPTMVLPRASEGYYSNGRYAVRGGGRNAQWEVGRAAPVTCTGG